LPLPFRLLPLLYLLSFIADARLLPLRHAAAMPLCCQRRYYVYGCR